MTLTQLNSLARHAFSCSQPVCHHALAPRRPWASCSLRHWHQHAASQASQAGRAERQHWPRHHPCHAASRLYPACGCQRSVATSAAVAEAAPPAEQQADAAPAPSFQAFLDWKALRADLQQHRDNVQNRNSSADPDKALALYDSWRQLEDEASRLRSDRNSNAKAMKGKLEPERRAELVEQGKALKERLAQLEEEATAARDAMQREGQRLPNLAHPQAPVGGEEASAVLETVGTRPQHAFATRNHLELGAALDLLDFEAAAVTSGSKFVYLRRAAALLELALCTWSMVELAKRGFTPVTTPDLVQAAVLEKCGFQPRGTNTQVYTVEDSSLCLTGTAEVPLGALHMDQTLSEAQLPIRLAGFGHCFRTEAGAAGAASKGLYRLHQFSKVEMFVISTPEQSEALLQELCDVERDLFSQLGLHFRILDMATGDLGAPAYRKLDIEAWMPGLDRYGEISSASNCTDYQSRRLNIRYKPDEAAPSNGAGKQKAAKAPSLFVHTLNATACAVPRMLLAILENFQREDGSVDVPTPLQPYVGGLTRIEAVQ